MSSCLNFSNCCNCCLSLLFISLVAGWCNPVTAQETEENRYYHFQTSSENVDQWAWENVRAKMSDDVLVIKEANPNGDAGSIHNAELLPFNAEGVAKLHVAEVPSGYYSLQLMAFKNQTYIGEINLVKDSKSTDEQTFEFADIEFPEDTDAIGFKFWVAGSKKPVSHLQEIAYWENTDDDARTQLLETDRTELERWECENIALEPSALGIKATLEKGHGFGSVFCKDQAKFDPESTFIVELGNTVQGFVKVQGVAFDKSGKVLGNVSIAEHLAVGRHKIEASTLDWPADTEVVTLKLWLEGEKNASTVIRGVKVLK